MAHTLRHSHPLPKASWSISDTFYHSGQLNWEGSLIEIIEQLHVLIMEDGSFLGNCHHECDQVSLLFHDLFSIMSAILHKHYSEKCQRIWMELRREVHAPSVTMRNFHETS